MSSLLVLPVGLEHLDGYVSVLAIRVKGLIGLSLKGLRHRADGAGNSRMLGRWLLLHEKI